MSNLLIVESKNDQFFMKALIDHLNLNDIRIGKPICLDEEDYKCLQGSDPKKVITALKEVKTDIESKDIYKIGLIIDRDLLSREERLQFVNTCLQEVYPDSEYIAETNQLYRLMIIEDRMIEFACYFTHVDGQGELETLLKAIKSQDSIYADCLEDWRTCLEKQGQIISQKDFDKFWISNYLRFDTCSRKEEKQANKKCSMSGFEYVMLNKPQIWNFAHPMLDKLKDFSRLFA